MLDHYCSECGKNIRLPSFNFCPHCGVRIVGPFNHELDHYLNVTIPEDDDPNDPLRRPRYPHCYRCIWVIIDDFDKYCSMCGYKLDGNESHKMDEAAKFEKKPIFLGRFDYMLDSDEYSIFTQEDVAWYGDTFNHRDQMYLHTSVNFGNVRIGTFSHIDDGLPDIIFDLIAAGTLYLTNKRRIILYDPGFSNIWTRLSASGDFPEQVKIIHLDEIKELYGDTHRIDIRTVYGDVQLAPSNRKYNGRKTPFLSEYDSFSTFYKMLVELLVTD